MPSVIEHEAIAASAGSGKTFQLAHRYIRLLASGVPPDRVIALTFSRKAASEIFDAIVEHLGKAAASDEAARERAGRIGMPRLRRADFLRLLRRFLDSLHRLHIGTLDSFIMGILRAFPTELGIPADFRILDNDSSASAEFRREVLARIFNPNHLARGPQRDFLQAFKQATFGREEKALGDRLDAFIDENREKYQRLPDGAAWGSEHVIWSETPGWLAGPVDMEAVARQIRALPVMARAEEGISGRWETFLAAASRFQPGSPWTKDIEYLFLKLADSLGGLRRGSAEIVIDRKKTRLGPDECRLALQAVRHVMRCELQAVLRRTGGIFGILEQYERLYDTALRQTGQLTFSDAQYLLTEHNAYSGGALLSRLPGGERRLYVDYRLDCKLDHWLLDEFQDTSDLQWAALGNLGEEILQDVSGERSFFYVGDVKQAIYGWRGGNRRLFGGILKKYETVIRQKPLSTSYRSDQAVIDTVNAVFGQLAEADLPEPVLAEWKAIWQTHACRTDPPPKTGYAAILEPQRGPGGEKPEPEDRYRVAACLLREIDPLARGLSAAILVRTNDAGRAAADVLRRECPGMAIVHEGHAPILDNPVVAVLLSLVRFATHPGDGFALRHLQSSPLAKWFGASATAAKADAAAPGVSPVLCAPLNGLAADGCDRTTNQLLAVQGVRSGVAAASARQDAERARKNGDAPDAPLDALPLHLLREIEIGGFQGLLRRWGERLGEQNALDEFGRLRLRDLLRAASEFDATGNRDGNSFLRFIERHEVSESAAAASVRVMTIHQSKGLGFDIVVLPDLMGRSSMTRGGQPGILLARDPQTDEPRWALDMPRRVIAEQDPVLSEQMQAFDEEACFDALCVLYVALTRARHALYMVTSFPGPASKAFDEAALLKHLLTGDVKADGGTPVSIAGEPCLRLYEKGDCRWQADFKPVPERRADAGRRVIPPGFPAKPSRRKRLVQVEPSAKEEIVSRAAWLFDAESRDVLDFGTGIHALFARIGWIEDTDPEAIIRAWIAAAPPGKDKVRQDVCTQFRRAFTADDVRQALARPVGTVDLWSEKRFEIILDGGRWVSGAFDRVVICRDARGNPSGATILDYKSDRIDDANKLDRAAEKYRPQLALYAQALSVLLKLDLADIRLQLLFTRPAQLVAVAAR